MARLAHFRSSSPRQGEATLVLRLSSRSELTRVSDGGKRLPRRFGWYARRRAICMRIPALRDKETLAPAIALAASLVVHGMALGSDFCDEDLRHLYEVERFGVLETLVL